MELQWIDVKERLPEDKPTKGHGLCNVLACCKNYFGEFRVEQLYYLGNGVFTDNKRNSFIVTHWMPLPDIPKYLKQENLNKLRINPWEEIEKQIEEEEKENDQRK